MYSPAFQMLLAGARIEDLRRARVSLIQPQRTHTGRTSRAAAGWGLLSRVGMRRLVAADPSHAS